jgi:hypothetical protein
VVASAGGVVRDLGEHRVERRDQEVDAEPRRHTGERGACELPDDEP